MSISSYTQTMNENGEAPIYVSGNFIMLAEVSAPNERYLVTGLDAAGAQIFSVYMAQGGKLKIDANTFQSIRVSNQNAGAGTVTVVAGSGDYDEGGGSGGAGQGHEFGLCVEHTATADGEVFYIPENDSRKWLWIQTDEFNTGAVMLQDNFKMYQDSEFERPIKGQVKVTFEKLGDSIVYLEEV